MRESAISQTEQSSGLLADKILPVLCWIAMVVVAFLFAGTAAAQRPANRVPTDQAKAGGENAMEDAAGSRTQRTGDRRPAKKDRKRRSNAAASEKDEMPEPRPVILKTKDGVDVRAFYFPSDKGKEAIPVLIVHEWQGQASPYLQLVLALRDAGCAVLVPDYRGHGGSVNYMDRRGKERRYDVSRMSKRDVMSIIAMDLEKAKGFLKDENDQGNLNLNAMVVIGIREGCIMATTWAARDWNFPSVGRLKQGQDVKAIVMVSPDKQVKGVPIDPSLKDWNILNLPILIVGGKNNPEAKETRRIAKRIEGAKLRASGGRMTGFELRMIDTALTGPALVNEASDVIPTIVNFIQSEVRISAEENPWIKRE